MTIDLEKMVTSEPNTTTKVVELKEDKFATFMKLARMVGGSCSDFIIKNGIIRQLSDRRSLIFDINVSSLMGDVQNLSISAVNNKMDILEPFMKQQVPMKLIVEEITEPEQETKTNYIFTDGLTDIQFIKPLDQYINNEVLSPIQLKNSLMIGETPTIISEFSINKMYLDRLSALERALAASLITVDFKDKKAIFKVVSNDNNEAIKSTIYRCEIDQNITGFCQFPIQALLCARDELQCEIIKRGSGETLVLKLKSTIDGIPIELWSISEFRVFEE